MSFPRRVVEHVPKNLALAQVLFKGLGGDQGILLITKDDLASCLQIVIDYAKSGDETPTEEIVDKIIDEYTVELTPELIEGHLPSKTVKTQCMGIAKHSGKKQGASQCHLEVHSAPNEHGNPTEYFCHWHVNQCAVLEDILPPSGKATYRDPDRLDEILGRLRASGQGRYAFILSPEIVEVDRFEELSPETVGLLGKDGEKLFHALRERCGTHLDPTKDRVEVRPKRSLVPKPSETCATCAGPAIYPERITGKPSACAVHFK